VCVDALTVARSAICEAADMDLARLRARDVLALAYMHALLCSMAVEPVTYYFAGQQW